MKVLVTGANGLLGHHVVFKLLENKHEVSIIVRNSRNIHFDLNKVRVCDGSFTDYRMLKAAAEGCDAIIHIAAVTDTEFLHYDEYASINVEASEQLIRVADEHTIKNLVFVSTANTIGFGTKTQLADETWPAQFPFTESFYARSKTEAEELFRKASLLPDRHVIILNPTFIIGGYDTKPSSGKLILLGYKKHLMVIPRGGKNFVPAVDVATAACNALTQGRNGERYLIAGENMSFKRFYKLQSIIAGYDQRLIILPDFVMRLVGKFGDFLALNEIKTELRSMNLRQLIIFENYSNAKAKAELSYQESPLIDAIREAIDWFKKRGKIS